MPYQFSNGSIEDISVDCLIIPVAAFSRVSSPILRKIDKACGGAVHTLVDSGEFSGSENQTVVLYRPEGFSAERILLVGIGDSRKVSAETMRRALGIVSRVKAIKSSKSAAFYLGKIRDSAVIQAAAEGYLLGGYKITEYKTENPASEGPKPEKFWFIGDDRRSMKRISDAAGRGEIIAQGQILARQLAMTPANDLTPRIYTAIIQKLARRHGLRCTVLDEAAIRKEKMGALLGVAQGSAEPPRLVILEHRGKAGQQPIVLVGKGVTFDTGGISLKPAATMYEMKQDMAGSAAVVGALVTAARLGTKVNLMGVMPIAENMPSGTAFRPGDIITSRKGLTIEVTNTDAEGRLILADALDYVNKFKPAAVIDIATLTGATKFILGYEGAPVVGTNRSLMSQLARASQLCGERTWELPLWDEHGEMMKSSIADLHNSDGSRSAGTLTAAAFLKRFIGDYPWAHIDMAYVDLEPKGRAYIPRGASGFGVRLFIELISNWKSLKN